MKASGLANGNTISSMGFTIGVPQDSVTKGSFKVYLQNTTDAVSRVDTNWTNVTDTTNSLNLSGLTPGKYEWQVRTNCATPSAYSPVASFSNDNLGTCSPPTNLNTTNITTVSAVFNWVAPASAVTNYYIEYKNQDSTSWVSDSVSGVSYTATGLIPNKHYQWHIKTICSGDTSTYLGGSFVTNAVNSCSAPANLTNGTITDTSASVSWTAAAGATYYSLQYRRKGTADWLSASAFTNAYTFKGLGAGTTYEWQVRTVCGAGTGAFISGADFTTTGTTACYAPVNLSANSITDSSVVFTWTAVPGVTSYDVRYRLKGAISWTNAITSMTEVHKDSLSIPNSAGAYTVTFKGGSAFTYSGNGVYVACEYSNSTSNLSSANTTISTTANTVVKNIGGQDSLNLILALTGISKNNTNILPTTLTSTNQRPETRFGSSSLKDSVEVSAVYALGKIAPSFTSSSISALIINHSGISHSYPVTLKVKEQKTNVIRYTTTQNVTVDANDTQLITFTGWSPSLIETDSLIVSIPVQANENVVNNNSNYYIQKVTESIISYDDGSNAITKAGNDTIGGLLLNKYTLSGCGKINSVKVYLSSSAAGHSVYGVALNASKTIIAKSSPFTPDSTQVNNYHTFYFPTQVLLKNEDFYVGLAQPASADEYLPVGVQWEGASARNNAYYRAKLNGDSLTNQPVPGRLMIAAELVSGIPVPSITGKLSLCSSTTDTLTAGSTNVRFADKVINFSSQNSGLQYSADKALGTTDVFPDYAFSPDEWLSATADGRREYLTLHFSNPAQANFIDIYETLNPGAVDSVYVKNPSTSNYDLVYSGTATAAAKSARRNRISFPLTSYNVSEVRIAINSPAVPGYNAIDAVSIGELQSPATFTNYLWSPGGETTQTKSVSDPGTYTLTVTDVNGCQASDSVSVISPVQVVPTITATRPTTFCNGDSTILKSSQKGGNTWSTGATTDSIIVKMAGSYTVTYDDGTSCGTTKSSATTVTVNASPVVSITGATAICSGGSSTLDAGAGYTNYSWSTGAVSQTINVNAQGTYTVKVTNSDGCKATGTVTTTVAPNLSPTIAGSLSFCPGNSTTLDAGPGYSSYVWSTGARTRTLTVNTAGTFSVSVTNSGGCSGTSSVTTSLFTRPSPAITGNLTFCAGTSTTLDAGAGYNSFLWSTGDTTRTISVTAAGNYPVTVTNSNGCSGTASVNTSLYTPPTPAITGNTGFCPGGSATLSANDGFSTYLWSTKATAQSINVSTPGTYTVTVTDSHGCSANTAATINQYTPPSPVISGTLSFCGGNSTTLDAGSGYNSYLWSTQATTQTITATTVGTFSVTVTDNKGCTGSASVTTTKQSSLPKTPGPISGVTTGLCNTTGNVYSISPVSNASSYVWTVPSGATIAGGQGTTSITVNYGSSFTSGNIVVAAANACGQSSSLNPQTLAVHSALGTPAAINGQLTGLCGQTSKQYSIDAVPAATSYTWTVPAGATVASGQGTTTVTVNFSNSFSSGNICVKADNSCSSGGSKCVTLSKVPSITTGISGPVNVCSKQQGVTYSIPAVTGATTYTWTVPSQATITSGQGTNTITVKFSTKGGNVTVKASNSCGSSNVQSLAVIIKCTTTITNTISSKPLNEDVSVQKNMKIYPNPTTGIVNLRFENYKAGAYRVNVFDVTGKMVYSKGLTISGSSIVLDLRHLSKGTYLLNLVSDNSNDIEKVIIN